MSVDRRDVFKIIGAGLVTAETVAAAPPRAFTQAEYDRLTTLVEEIIPGAAAAGVPWYIDTVLHYGDARARTRWQQGLAQIQGVSAAELDRRQDAFFMLLKRTAVEGYFLSEAGKKACHYQGDRAVAEFRGCEHERH